MKCNYIYREGDELVKSGDRQIGEVCGSKFGSKDMEGYCPAHARQMGTISPERLANERERRAKTKEAQRERNDSATPPPKEQIGQAANPDNPILNNNVLEAMGLKDPCDLAAEYEVFKATNSKPTYEDYNKKMAFARWLETPPHLRNPKTIERAAEVLGVATTTLFVWKNLPEVIDFINMDTENRALGMFPLAVYKLGVNIDRGDVKSIQALMEFREKKQIEKNKTNKALNIPQDILKEANDYARAVSIGQNKGVALSAEKNMVTTNHFNESMIEDREN